jgi:hypothetical protein
MGRLLNAAPAGLVIALRSGRMIFLAASAILSVEPVETSEE